MQSNKTKKGFTLLEMLISVTLFSLVMTIALSAVLTILDINRKTQSLTAITNTMNSTLDSMVRLMKSGEKDFQGGNLNECPLNSQVDFVFYDTEEIYGSTAEYYDISFVWNCEDEALYREIRTRGSEGSISQFIRLTPEGVRITRAEFIVDSVCQDRVQIFIEGIAGENRTQTDFTIQTSVTRRSVVGTGSCT